MGKRGKEDGRKKGRVAGDATQNPKAMGGGWSWRGGEGVRFRHVVVSFPSLDISYAVSEGWEGDPGTES